MRIALRHGEKPFVPHQPVTAIAAFLCFGSITEYVRTALLFRHPHADQQAALLRPRRKMGVVAIAHQRR